VSSGVLLPPARLPVLTRGVDGREFVSYMYYSHWNRIGLDPLIEVKFWDSENRKEYVFVDIASWKVDRELYDDFMALRRGNNYLMFDRYDDYNVLFWVRGNRFAGWVHYHSRLFYLKKLVLSKDWVDKRRIVLRYWMSCAVETPERCPSYVLLGMRARFLRDGVMSCRCSMVVEGIEGELGRREIKYGG